MELIDKQLAINEIINYKSESYITINNLIDKDVARTIIEDLPSIQSEIIKCKDCKYFEPIYTFDKGACGHWHARANASDFCSYAERENNV